MDSPTANHIILKSLIFPQVHPTDTNLLKFGRTSLLGQGL
jgi:hypothetical protein